MKIRLLGFIITIAAGLGFVQGLEQYLQAVLGVCLVAGFGVLALSFQAKELEESPTDVESPSVEGETPSSPVPQAKVEQAPDYAEVVQLLGLLQKKGRFIDFVKEDVAGFSDAQIAAAARVVHQGCREVMNEQFEIQAIAEGAEGAAITLAKGYAPADYRLLGQVNGEPPYDGKLLHKGWRAQAVHLPRLSSSSRGLPPIMPAEVELK